MSNLLDQTDPDVDLDLDLPAAPPAATDDLDLDLPTAAPVAAQAPVVEVAMFAQPLMEVLPSDFPLPALIRFVPNGQLKVAVEQATAYALAIDVTGTDGLQRADLALTALRGSQKAITEHFAEPVEIANRLHKRLTTLRGEWCEAGEKAIKAVGNRIYTEQMRLEQLAAEARRKAQEEADRQARDAARTDAEAAEKAKAPEPVVQELKRQAETATAPPVAMSASTPPALKGSSTVTTWKARLVGTPADAEPNPEMSELSPAQREQVKVLLRAVLDGSAPWQAVGLNWSYLNGRAKGDTKTLAIPGIEAFVVGGVRAKSSRAK